MKVKMFCIALIGILLTGCAQSGNTEIAEETLTETSEISGEPHASDKTETKEEAPYVLTFEATTIDGETVTAEHFSESELTMINVWATYCNPCLEEMPDLAEIAASYDTTKFQILGIISDVEEGTDEEGLQTAKDLIEQTKADYPHLLLNESLYVSLVGAVEAVPTTFFVNSEGELLGYVVGARSKEGWEEIIQELLEKSE